MTAEKFGVWEYIKDELKARGWSQYNLARAMGGDTDKNMVALDYLRAFSFSPRFTIGETMAAQLERAFGVSAETWLNLDKQARSEGRT